MVGIEVVLAGVVPLQSCYLVMGLVLMRTVPRMVVQTMGVYGYTCLVQVGVDLGSEIPVDHLCQLTCNNIHYICDIIF